MATNRMEPNQIPAPPASDGDKYERRRASVLKIALKKQKIQKLARALIDAHLKSQPAKPGEKAQLLALLSSGDAPVYHRAMPLEAKLRDSENTKIRRLVSSLERERKRLHGVMDTYFPRERRPNQDLLWAFVSLVVAPLFLPVISITPYFAFLLIVPPLFFVGRKIWRFFNDLAPYDFSLKSYGVTPEEYKDILGSESENLSAHRAAKSTSPYRHKKPDTAMPGDPSERPGFFKGEQDSSSSGGKSLPSSSSNPNTGPT